jgi:hypothetical protein
MSKRNIFSFGAILIFALVACTKSPTPARAFQIQSRADLIGGKRGLGDVEPAVKDASDLIGGTRALSANGDFKLSNGIIHAIIQNVGTSRGFGSFGGSLIDIDLVRTGAQSSAKGVTGNDYFTEMFPAFFLTAIEPGKVEVLNDGSDGNAAAIRVSGKSGDFISIVKSITSLVDPTTPLDYTCDYILEPGKQYLKIVVTVTNSSPDDVAWTLTVPFGFVTLLGEGQRLFVPGQAGFDMRFHLEDTVYKRNAALDALPGEVAEMWTTQGDGVSYALVAGRNPEGSYLDKKPNFYPTATKDSFLIPLASSSFLASYWAKSPAPLAAKSSFTYTGYLAVGDGDVASVQRVVYGMRETITRGGREFVQKEKVEFGTISGIVREAKSLKALSDVSVVLKNQRGEYVSQALTDIHGRYSAPVPPGQYTATAVERSRTLGRFDTPTDITAGSAAQMDIDLEQNGMLNVLTLDSKGLPIPTKISVEAIAQNDVPKRLSRNFLYDLKVGENVRTSDMILDDPKNENSRRYLERIFYTDGKGQGSSALKPGKYKVYVSRGMEYNIAQQDIEIVGGKQTSVGASLTQVIDTPNWISGDFHVHSIKSVDSEMAFEPRVTSFAVEGVDFLSSTDHNHVSDFAPTIEQLGLSNVLKSVVGLELTSLEMGHFNAFPLQLLPGPVQHGSFRWFYRPPRELFAQLRALGTDPQNTIVQVNHPRDTVLGYFNAFNFGSYSGVPIQPLGATALDTTPQKDGTPSPYHPSNFSTEFDAIELLNSKRIDALHAYKIPTTPVEGKDSTLPSCPANGVITVDCIPKPGEVVERVAKDLNGASILQPAFPGVLDEWYKLLGQGHKIVGTGNSDSHGPKTEAGLPRTYIEAGATANGSMRALNTDDVFKAFRQGRVFVTNGPFLEVSVNGQGIGSSVVAGDGEIDVKISIKAADWVDVKRVRVVRGGKDIQKFAQVLEEFSVPASKDILRLEVTKHYKNIPDGSFIVVEVEGDEPMWPVYPGYEFPSIQLSDAIGVFGASFGFGDKYGKYQPAQEQFTTPFAFTNPIWVNRVQRQPLTTTKFVLPVSNDQPFKPRVMTDLRKLFHAFHSDPE